MKMDKTKDKYVVTDMVKLENCTLNITHSLSSKQQYCHNCSFRLFDNYQLERELTCKLGQSKERGLTESVAIKIGSVAVSCTWTSMQPFMKSPIQLCDFCHSWIPQLICSVSSAAKKL